MTSQFTTTVRALGGGETAVPLRAQIVRAAAKVTCETGWSSVRMGQLADMIGVSRQTVYNEIGSKQKLAEEMVLAELRNFLVLVESAFERNPGDVVAAIREACRNVLEFAGDNPLLRAVVSASHGSDNDLLPLLTTQSQALIATAKAVVRDRLTAYTVPLSDHELEAATDLLVRAVLSHVMRPSDTPERSSADIAMIAARILGTTA
ncbi:TetR/AcrR family transcriptional regulator [Amycolatopsis cynarae]|uniref:TetR/AcrR family transcriptional regulator n=1 Tax=Amycolatopsis cynarae TaxID=2995223 RepID=UPI002E10B990